MSALSTHTSFARNMVQNCKKPKTWYEEFKAVILRPRTTQSLIVKHYPLSKQLLGMVTAFHLWLGINFETVGSEFFISRAIEPQFTLTGAHTVTPKATLREI